MKPIRYCREHLLRFSRTDSPPGDRPAVLSFSVSDETEDTFLDLADSASIDEIEADLESSFNEITGSTTTTGPNEELEQTTDAINTLSGIDTDICGTCYNGFYHPGGTSILCDNCDIWFHISCVGISLYKSKQLSKAGVNWFCVSCRSEIPSHHPQMGFITQTLADLDNHKSQRDVTISDSHSVPASPADPVSLLSQAVRNYKESSSSFCDPFLPEVEQPRKSLSNARWGILQGMEIAETINSTYMI